MTLSASRAVLGLVATAIIVSACGRGNGLPPDLANHLADRGIPISISGFDAPLSSRGGFVFFEEDPSAEAKIVAEFGLKEIDRKDRMFLFVSGKIPEKPKVLWGVAGRPKSLRLKDGAQLEFLYLLTTFEGRTYIFSEYAYG